MTKVLFTYPKEQGKPRPDFTYRGWRRSSWKRARRAGGGIWVGVEPDRGKLWPPLVPKISRRGEVWFAFAYRPPQGSVAFRGSAWTVHSHSKPKRG